MAEHTCKECQILLDDTNCYKGWINKSKYLCKCCAKNEARGRRTNLKLMVLEEYGNVCTCCKENKIEFLTIDHIDGKGAEHRKSLGLSFSDETKTVAGHSFYRWLKKNNFPKDNFQILCFNCNYAKHVYGVCPHKHS